MPPISTVSERSTRQSLHFHAIDTFPLVLVLDLIIVFGGDFDIFSRSHNFTAPAYQRSVAPLYHESCQGGTTSSMTPATLSLTTT